MQKSETNDEALLEPRDFEANMLYEKAKQLLDLPQPIAREMIKNMIAQFITYKMGGHHRSLRLSDLTKALSLIYSHNLEEKAKNMLLKHGGKRLELVNDFINGYQDLPTLRRKAEVEGKKNLRSMAYNIYVYEKAMSDIRVLSAKYWRNIIGNLDGDVEDFDIITANYETEIAKLITTIRMAEDRMAERLSPFAWLVRDLLKVGQDNSKKYVEALSEYPYHEYKSYERDWLPFN